jgi:hypothetical protein
MTVTVAHRSRCGRRRRRRGNGLRRWSAHRHRGWMVRWTGCWGRLGTVRDVSVIGWSGARRRVAWAGIARVSVRGWVGVVHRASRVARVGHAAVYSAHYQSSHVSDCHLTESRLVVVGK